MFGLILGAEPQHPLDASPVVPAAIENHDLSRCRQVWQVALGVHLRLLPLGRRRECHDPEDARAHSLGHSFDRAALAGSVAAFEDDADPKAFVHHPLLELDKLDVQTRELPLVFFLFQLAFAFAFARVTLGVGLWIAHIGALNRFVAAVARMYQNADALAALL